MLSNPPLIDATRGGFVESLHRGLLAVVDRIGELVFSIGDIDAPVFPRSAVKPIQALPLVASGAADHFGFSDAEIALACGSHVGSPAHVATAESMLRKAGKDVPSLECGPHWPLDESEGRSLAARAQSPSPLHNNCSGKHAGFIALACFRGHDPRGYIDANHPAMREVTEALATVTATPLATASAGVDGCSIPAFAIPLRALALGFARLGTGEGLPGPLATASGRIRAAMAAEPLMVAGHGRFDTRVAEACGGAILVKSGAEGVACGTIPGAGLGIAVKIDDGAGRAATAAMAALLLRFAGEWLDGQSAARGMLKEFASPILRNWNGIEVGSLRPTATLGP